MRVFIKSFGCQSNFADSENIAGILESNGFTLTQKEQNADAVIVNTCGVKNPTNNNMLTYISSLKNNKIYVGGCLASIIDIRKYCKNVTAVFDTNSLLKIPEILIKKEDFFSKEKEFRILLPRVRINKDIGIINISQGCLNRCTFCATKLARGNLKSYPIKDIKKELEKALKEGCKIIYISSQDNSCYGIDINTNLVELLTELTQVDGDFKIRVGMGNPQWFIRLLPKIIDVFQSDKIMKFLHMPVQSGSNKLLREMRRGHTVEQFKLIVHQFRGRFPNITISTDIIVGYPTETQEDFQQTIDLIKEIKPEVLNISKYSPRPKTHGSKLKQLSSQEIKKRSKIITELYKNYKHGS